MVDAKFVTVICSASTGKSHLVRQQQCTVLICCYVKTPLDAFGQAAHHLKPTHLKPMWVFGM